MGRIALGVVAVVSSLALAAATAPRTTAAALPLAAQRVAGPDPNQSPSYRLLNNPSSSDDFYWRRALQSEAQTKSDALFSALSSLLGGTAPKINTVPTGSPLVGSEAHISANGGFSTPYTPLGTINADPLAMAALIDNASPYHNGAVNQFPHEMAHLRQIASVLASVPTREGGAQSFADIVAPEAARRAGIPYAPGPDGNFDGAYAQFVQQVNAQRGRDWVLAGQFGKPGSPVWP